MSKTKKSNFSATCNQLNQYIREKKSIPEHIGGLNFNTILSQGPTQDSYATLELFPGTELNKTCTTKPGMKQLTIFYNGEVVSYDSIDVEKAADLIALAMSVTTLREVNLNMAAPMARRKSLQQFLQKRKDRLSSNAPYSSKHASYDEKAWL